MAGKWWVAVPVAALLIGASACGSSSSSGSSGTSAASEIVVTVMGTFQAAGADYGDAAAAIQASADQVNAAGGIHGHKLKVIVCDDQENPNQAETCARQAVSDNSAVVLSPTESTGFGAQTLPVLAAAGIPDVDEPAVVPTDWTSSNVFPLDPGEPAQYAAVALALKQHGCTKVGSLQLPVASGAAAAGDLGTALTKIGGSLVLNVKTGMSEPTYAPQVAQLISAGAQCVVPIILPTEISKLISAINQSGKKLPIGGVTAAFNQQLLTSLGTAADGIILAGGNYLPTDTTIPSVEDMITAMKKYTPSTPPTDTYGTSAWGAATLVFSSVMPAITGPITASSVMKALDATKNATVGTYAPYTFAQPAPNSQFPRLRNPGILTWVVQNDVPKLTSSGFININQALQG